MLRGHETFYVALDDTDVAFIIADSNASKNTELVTLIVCSCVGVKD